MAGNPNHGSDGKFSSGSASGHNAGKGNRAVAKHIAAPFIAAARGVQIAKSKIVKGKIDKNVAAHIKKNPIPKGQGGIYQVKNGKKVYSRPK